jgi:hypothetical protein
MESIYTRIMACKSKTASTTRHLWVLDPVVIELQSCPAVRAHEMAELMLPDRIGFLDSSTGTVFHRFNKPHGSPESACLTVPTLHDTGARRLQPRSLKNILEMDQSWMGDAQFYPPLLPPLFLPLLGDADRERMMRELLEHLDDQHYAACATTFTFRSSVIDRYLKPFVGSNETDDTLPQLSANTNSIMHCGALLPLEASALMSSSTIHLITGVRVYIVYPPSPHNTMTVQKYFIDLANDSTPRHQSVCNDLQEGITFVQRAGQTVTIPPFCPTIVFSTTTSAGVTIRSRCCDDVSMRVRQLGLMVAQVRAVQHVCQETADASLEYHIAQLYKDLSMVLKASERNTSTLRLTLALGAAWKEQSIGFQALVEEHILEPLRGQIRNNIPRLWSLAVRKQGLEECPVCNVNLSDLGIAFTAHFQKEHWNQTESFRSVNDGLVSIAGGDLQ